MPVTREESIPIADAFVRERDWGHGWSHKRLSVREVEEERSSRRCWLVWCHSPVIPPMETRVWVDVADGSVRRATRLIGRAVPEVYEAG